MGRKKTDRQIKEESIVGLIKKMDEQELRSVRDIIIGSLLLCQTQKTILLTQISKKDTESLN